MADVKISALPSATNIAGEDLLVIDQGLTTKNATVSLLTRPPVTQPDYGSFTDPDGGNLFQPSRLTLSGTERATISGAGRIVAYDAANYSPLFGVPVNSYYPGSFTLKSGQFIKQYSRLTLNGNARATLTQDSQILLQNAPANSLDVAFLDVSNTFTSKQQLVLNGNSRQNIILQNVTNGSAALAAFTVQNDAANIADFSILSTGYTASGVLQAGDTVVRANTGNLVLTCFAAATVIKFAAAGSAETARIGAGLMVGTTTDPGAGNINATGYKGTITSDNAAAGMIGEFVESAIDSAHTVSLVSTIAKNITSISLTAGDWDISGQIAFLGGAGTTFTAATGSWSFSSGVQVEANKAGFGAIGLSGAITISDVQSGWYFGLPIGRATLSATTTIFLVGQATFATSTCGGFGRLTARRVR